MSPGHSPAHASGDDRGRHIRAEQVRLLQSNVGTAVGVTVFVTFLLSFLQWSVIPHRLILGWAAYMLFVCSGRFALPRLYSRAFHDRPERWGAVLSLGAGLSGAGWGAAGVLLYPAEDLAHQLFLAFVLGGMMLGAVSLLAARPEAVLAFVVPIGLPIAVRFLISGDRVHLGMGLLVCLFAANILVTTRGIYRTIKLSLSLRFENRELVEGLQAAKTETETLNQQLESRVEERTSELHDANQRLRAEMEQRMQTEDELLRARKLEAVGVLAGGIAHDFNNFLTIVQGNIGLARLELQAGRSIEAILDQITGACARAASLAGQLLTFGKGGAPVRRAVSVGKLLEDTVALARAGANVGIELDIAPNLWPGNIDESQISHALHNMLLNARQAMPDGGLIEVKAENYHAETGTFALSPGRYIKLMVQDHGAGIPSENLPKIFDPYFTTKSTGTGLGLAAAHAIVTKHEGHIFVDSKLGAGTTFSIYLPACDAKPSDQGGAGPEVQGGSGRILVMDDEEPLRILLRRALERFSYEVECARDGAEAVGLFEAARASGRRFDAVLLDLTVPGGMGGKDAAAKLREMDPSVPLIVSSGYSEDPVLSDFQAYGFKAALRKPWAPAEVNATLRQVIEEARAQQPEA